MLAFKFVIKCNIYTVTPTEPMFYILRDAIKEIPDMAYAERVARYIPPALMLHFRERVMELGTK